MRVLFYSKKCDFCHKIIDLLKNKNIIKNFKCICIEEINIKTLKIKITSVPALIVPESKYPLVGKAAFDFLSNKQYFDHPTNNVMYWQNKQVPKPEIVEDKKAQSSDKKNFGSLNDDKSVAVNSKPVKKNNALLEEVMRKRNILDKEMGFNRKKF